MYGYIYLTTNTINNKSYIGKHKASQFDPNYKGSGKYLWNAIGKHGWDNFTTTIIEWCETESILDQREKYWISYYDAVKSKQFYNLNEGGHGSWEYINSHGLSSKNKPKRYGANNSFYGHHHTEESKKRISSHHDYSHMYGNKNPNANRVYTDADRKRMSNQSKVAYQNMDKQEKERLRQLHRQLMTENNCMRGITKSEATGWHLEERILKNGKRVKRWIKNK